MSTILDYLQQAVEQGASDVFIIAGCPVGLKVRGQIRYADDQKLLPQHTEELITATYEIAKRPMDIVQTDWDDDFSISVPHLARFRVSAFKQRGSLAAVIRVVAFDIPSFEERHIPEQVMNLANMTHGMILITGTAGSGKSTTQACIIDRINKTRNCHIITLEDPIEYLHRDCLSIVSQREIAIDTAGYLTALRSCLRQAPDVIQLGEMRDSETISTAMTAAETGHLLIATLHTKGAVNTIDRIIDSFPADQQAQVRTQLSSVLRTVVCQELLPSTDGGLVPAFEIMNMTPAIRNLIRDNKNHQINNAISSGAADGMISMNQYVAKLLAEGQITPEVAAAHTEK